MSANLEWHEPLHNLQKENRHHSHPLIRKLKRMVTLTEADTAVLSRISANVRCVAHHTELLREGEDPTEAIFILEGIAGRYKIYENGTRHIMAYIVPGDLCDPDIQLISNLDHTLGTLTSCLVCSISRQVLGDILDRHPNIARGLRLSKLVEEATTREWLVNVGRRSAIERLAHLLCELQMRLQAVGFATDDSFDLAITQIDLSDTLGLSNVHVNRTLKILRDQNLIRWHDRHITIFNLPRLKTIAGFNSDYLISFAS